MIQSVIQLLIAALLAYLVWWLVGLFIKDGTAMKIIGAILGLCVLLYGLRIFKVPILVFTLCLPLLIGCAHTTGTIVYNPKTGKKMLATSADAQDIKLTARGDFSATVLNHSAPIKARAAGVTAIVRGTGSAVGEGARTFMTPGL